MTRSQKTVGDYVTLVRGTTYKGALVGEPGPALLGLGSIEPGGGFRTGKYKTYGGDCPHELMLYPGDIYASLKGATKDGKMIGSVARVPPSVQSGRLTQDTVKLAFRTGNAVDRSFLYWVLRTPQYREYCAGHAMGSAVVALSRRDFQAYPVPPLTTDRTTVTSLLDAVEDKIELNRQMSETQEEIARALFKSWFVDFDPVHVQAGGRYADLPKPIGDPDSDWFKDSELGEIPRGWRVDTVYAIADVIYGSPFASSLFNTEGVGKPLVRIRDLESQDPAVFTSEVRPRGYLVRPGDLVVGMDGEFRAHLWRGGEAWLNQRVCCFRPRPLVPRSYVHYSIESLLSFFERSKTGTTVIHLGKSDIDTFRVLLPPSEVLAEFGRVVDPLDARIISAAEEVRALTALRDTLLTKLMSGQLRMPEVEPIAVEAQA